MSHIGIKSDITIESHEVNGRGSAVYHRNGYAEAFDAGDAICDEEKVYFRRIGSELMEFFIGNIECFVILDIERLEHICFGADSFDNSLFPAFEFFFAGS